MSGALGPADDFSAGQGGFELGAWLEEAGLVAVDAGSPIEVARPTGHGVKAGTGLAGDGGEPTFCREPE